DRCDYQKVRWYSDDESIATVDSEGLVSPCGVGTTDIYAKTEDGDYTAKCTVTVTTWENVKRIYLLCTPTVI
ncbi:protein containing Bacterial Ig-like, group 2 domain protein, partial [human gut metagenome]